MRNFITLINDLKNLKTRDLVASNSSEFSNQLKSIVGKSFNEEEVAKLINSKDNDFVKLINQKFIEKRKEREKILDLNQAREIEKRIFLQLIDQNWKLHIQYLEQLRQVIGLRSYGQRDPLVEYKKEAFALFENLLNKLKTDLVTILLNLKIIENPVEKENENNTSEKFKKLSKNKIGRNELCPCNSGKKYKHCHGSL